MTAHNFVSLELRNLHLVT